jgi:hypothetical protein
MSGTINQLMSPLADYESDFPAWPPRNQMLGPGGNYEALPGITSGAPPKPWGLNSDQFAQMLEQQRQRDAQAWQAAQEQLIQQKWANTYLGRVLPPVDYNVDPGAMLQRLPGASPNIRMPAPTWPRWQMLPADRET